jgi:cation diffusion facilitator family transporter
VHTLVNGSDEHGILIPYVVLAVAFFAEGSSWLKALHQVRGEARGAGRPLIAFLRESKDPTVKTVLSEDSAAVLGLVLAAIGIGMHKVTGDAWWDGAAAIAIGLLLAVVAILLGRDSRDLLIGEAADPALVVGVHELIAEAPEVDQVVELLTMHIGPQSVLVAARVDLRDDLRADQVEDFSTRVEHELAQRWPEVKQVFLDPTRSDPEVAERTLRQLDALRSAVASRD